MGMKLYSEASVQAIADAIRDIDGDATLMKIADMPDRIAALAGHGGVVINDTTDAGGGTIRDISATDTFVGKTSDDITVSGKTMTVPGGYYRYDTTKSVADGTAGTPVASKGSVSNHSISVTPSVTNTTGYITGGTKTGTAVSVTASELVSGTKTISDNGTGIDVIEYASVNVAIPFVTYYTGSSNPASSFGSNGDIYLKVVT